MSLYVLELALGLLFTASLVGLASGKRAYYVTLVSSAFLFASAVEGLNGLSGEIIPFLPTTVRIDSLSALFLLVTAFITFTISLYLLSYEVKGDERFLAMATNMALLSAVVFLSTNNIERLTLFYELFAVFTAVMVLASETRGSRKATWRYLVLTQVFGIIPLLMATGLAYGAVGSLHHLTFHGLRENLGNLAVSPAFLLVLFLSASLVRSGAFPFHVWVPRVYRSLPSPFIPVFLLGEALGVYMLLRVAHFVLPAGETLGYVVAFIGTVTAFATLYSFKEIRLKRKFAYHSVMDVGIAYFALGSSLVLQGTFLGTVALLGALLHVLYQVLYKSSLFFGLGAIEHYGEEPNICSMRKLLKGHVIALLMSLSVFSMAGIPPLSAFVSKWLIYTASMGTTNVLLWLMVVTIAFLGIFPLASIIQVRRINRLICKREVERDEVPFAIRTVTGIVSLASFLVAVFPFILLPWLTGSIEELGYPLPETPSQLFLGSPGSLIALVTLVAMAVIGWRIGKMPTERVSELLLIFYNMGDILRFTADYFLSLGKTFYLNRILPVIKVVPKHELPLIRDYDDALDYPVRHLDEAMFMPLIRAVERLARWGRSRNLDMNALISGFAIAMAILIVLLGVFT
ncbi:Formate hydrogenlyase subunit 3/Multisubunit Na+/H+ antiporter, MnhD subunit [Thermococcus nautili]|uniref:complex I subunit 5 family protein n=1 Tax=Thermococcus nautili TaxID=195522 RepID=UPI002556FFE9|nr:complex I subunit 5 family protein [Thermococcus nautili]CAI1493660.1 Formate hydrogenlyase subunit 3/Multisubunit Na+/H+ antiporter, MnhD subunit [Thermococcus nautili]